MSDRIKRRLEYERDEATRIAGEKDRALQQEQRRVHAVWNQAQGEIADLQGDIEELRDRLASAEARIDEVLSELRERAEAHEEAVLRPGPPDALRVDGALYVRCHATAETDDPDVQVGGST